MHYRKHFIDQYVMIHRYINTSIFQYQWIFKPGARRPVRAWFLEIVPVQTSVCVCVFVCVCPPLRLLITSGMMWRDMA